MNKIPIIEIFGPTIQGEGMVAGQKTMFVRTAGCDYSCNWCDSAFTWNHYMQSEIKQMTAIEIYNELKNIGGDCFSHVTITGGNPALLKDLEYFVDLLKENEIKISLETQGSKWQGWMLKIDEITLSPKPPSSGMKLDLDKFDMIINNLSKNNVSIKIVIFNDIDFDFSIEIYRRYKGIPFYLQTGNEYINETNNLILTQKLVEKYTWLIDKAINNEEMKDIKILPQIHTLVWGNKRGV
ncbi:MAG: 7-carboxy-7-deazaguanine synthase QueE [Defluviitaleaceae bacterium]|nr:7-carboxy-7-deazaguanine synthase QueE [Defluviitaleaceae bacterium]